jgi:hypothetical protein
VERHDRFALQVIAWDGASFQEGDEVHFDFDGSEWHSDAPRPATVNAAS